MITEKNILIPIPARLGDALFCTPAIQLLKKHHPEAMINIIALSSLAASLFQHNPDIHAVHTQPDATASEQLAKNTELVVNIHANDDAQNLTAALGIKAIYIAPPDQNQHQAEQALRFMQAQLHCELDDSDRQYKLYPQDNHFNKAKTLLIEQGIDPTQHIIIGLHLGCHGIAKQQSWKIWKKPTHEKVWPLKNFIGLAKQLQRSDSRIRFVITGSKGEETLAQKFAKKIPQAVNLVNKTSVLEMAALMDYMKIFICCDTGPMHVACATKVNLIALFGPTNLKRTGPYPNQPYRTIIQMPTLQDIGVSEVFAAAKKFLNDG